ncbi:hypothetical protein ACQ4PT_022237 [Festuca glaucescens]
MARVLHTSLVAPSPAGTALQESSLPLTSLDAIWLHAPPVERVFFYANATGNDVLSNLKDSLSRTLRDFYPLAGRLRLTPGTPNRHELHYKPGDGVNFTVAEYHHAGFDELATDDPTEVAKILPLVPALQAGGALLALQATMLSGGLTLGVTFHHGACDGVSSTHFLRTWAWAAPACAGANAPEPPVIDRTFIRDRDGLYDTFTAPRLSSDDEDDGGKPLGVISPDVHQLFATFTLSKEHLQRIKDAVAPASSGGDRAHLLFPADHRTRLDPPVPEKYLGNCVGPCFASALRKEVAAAGADGLFTACAAVAASIDVAPGYWDGIMERIMKVFSAAELPLTVAGWPRFRVYDTNFGFGWPVKVDVVSVARTGAMSVAEARGSDGGVEVSISLPAGGMERFRECFADAMACLSSSPWLNVRFSISWK